jgi:N-acetylneuraminic acid mutarotase
VIGGIPQLSPNATSVPTVNWVDVYSTTENTWRSVAPIPIPINHANAVAADGKVYVLGGMAGGDTWLGIPDCFEYTPETDTWKTLSSMPTGQGRGASALGVKDSTIYLAGGEVILGLITGQQVSVDTFTSYNVKTQKWTTLPSLPEGRDHVGGSVIDNTFYVVGGRVNGVTNVRNTTFALDLACPEKGWAEKAEMPTARGGISTASLGSTIYTFGGEGNRTLIANGVYNQTEAYNTLTDTWTKLDGMPYPRHGTNAAAVGRCIFIPGGGNVTAAGAVSVNDAFCI